MRLSPNSQQDSFSQEAVAKDCHRFQDCERVANLASAAYIGVGSW